jgi:hypothetical protein
METELENFKIIKREIENNEEIIEFNEGHVKLLGRHSIKLKNPFWRINNNGNEIILMYCEKILL